jgi:hypothetical protein
MNTQPLNDVLERLNGVQKSGEGWAAFCPAHNDTGGRSLTVSEGDDGRALVHCHKDCSTREVIDAIGLDWKDMFPKPVKRADKKRDYKVRDHTGRVVAIHHREDKPDGKKQVSWSLPDGKAGLGGLKRDSLPLWGTEGVDAVKTEDPIVLVEGEKAAFALTYRGVPAVGTVTGAGGTPTVETLSVLKDRIVVLWPDADEEGAEHMKRIGKLLKQHHGCDVRIYAWEDAPEKGDAADHPAILRGDETGLQALREALDSAPRIDPPHDPKSDGAATFDYCVQSYRELRVMRRQGGGITGIRSGLPWVDRATHGFNRGYSYIVAGAPSDGKSLFVGQVGLQAAMKSHRALIQAAEMSAIQYLDRFACYVAGVSYFDCQDGAISAEEDQRIDEAAEFIATMPLLIDDYGGQTVARIRENVERHEPDILLVDYLQFITPEDTRASRNQQVGQISRDLAAIKSDFNIPVVIAAQLNRESQRQTGSQARREPILSDLRDSGEIEQDADVVMMLHRPDKWNEEVRARDERIKILGRKNRMGQLWSTSVGFVDSQQWFTDQIRDAGYSAPAPVAVGETNGHFDDGFEDLGL